MLRRRMGSNDDRNAMWIIGSVEVRLSFGEVEVEEDVAKVAPVRAKAPESAQPPPAPPSKFSSDRAAAKGSEIGDSKGKGPKGQDSRGKGDSKGNGSKGK